VRKRLRVGIASKPNLLWLVSTDNIKTHKLDWSLYTCLTQLDGGIDVYNLPTPPLTSSLYTTHTSRV